MRQSLLAFQRFAGLEETGELDEKTKEMMAMPRCGVKDVAVVDEQHHRRRKKRYALQGKDDWRAAAIGLG